MKKVLVVCFMMVIVTAIASADLPFGKNGLLGYWDFEGDAADKSNHGAPADLTLGASASLGTYGGRNCLVVGSGADGGAHATYNDKWDDIVHWGTDKGGISSIDRGDGITIVAWVRPNDYTAEWKPIAGMCDSGWGARVFSNRSGARADTQTSNDGWNPIEAWNGEQWDDSDWHMVVYSFDWVNDMNYMWLDVDYGGGAYMNRWDKARTAGSGWWAASTDIFCVGTNLNDAGYNGYIDDVAIFSGIADDAAVAGLFDGTYNFHDVPIYSVPEPASLALLALGGLVLRKKK